MLQPTHHWFYGAVPYPSRAEYAQEDAAHRGGIRKTHLAHPDLLRDTTQYAVSNLVLLSTHSDAQRRMGSFLPCCFLLK